jgi:hypothetical protein
MKQSNFGLSLAVSTIAFFFTACDGTFRVKRDLQFDEKPSKDCVEQSIKKIIPDANVELKTFSIGETLIFRWKGPTKEYTGYVLFTSRNQKPAIELSSGGITAPTKSAMNNAKSAGNSLFEKLSIEIQKRCQNTVSIR